MQKELDQTIWSSRVLDMEERNTTNEDKMTTEFVYPQFFDTAQIPSLGWIQITHIGSENVYFTYGEGLKGFMKPLH